MLWVFNIVLLLFVWFYLFYSLFSSALRMCKALSMSRVIDVALLLVSGSKRHRGPTHHFSTHSCSRWPLRATTHQRSMNFYFFSRDYVSFSVSWKLSLVHSPSSSNFKRMRCQGFKIGCTLRTFPGSNISSQFHHSTGLPFAQTHAYDGLCYIRRVSQMSSQTCRDSGLFLCFHTHTTYITLLDAVDGVFFVFLIFNRQSKSNKLGDVLTFLHFVPQVSNLSALLSFNLCFAPGACWSRGCSKGFSYFDRTSAVKQQCEGLGVVPQINRSIFCRPVHRKSHCWWRGRICRKSNPTCFCAAAVSSVTKPKT